jgi:hypothetical protein
MNSRQIIDPKGSRNNCPPISEEILGEAAELLSFWPAIRNDPRLSPHAAADLLAVWAHLQRFPTADVAGNTANRLDRLVQDEKDRLVTQYLRLSVPALDEAIVKVDRTWDGLKTWDACEELESQTRDLFDALDRQSLAVYALQRFVPEGSSLRPKVDSLTRDVEKAEQTLLQYAESFYPAASLAIAMLEEYRIDLAVVDRPLWLTTVKYRRMADLYEQENTAPDLRASTGTATGEGFIEISDEAKATAPTPATEWDSVLAAQRAQGTKSAADAHTQPLGVSAYRLKDQDGRFFALETDPSGRVFVILLDNVCPAPPQRVRIRDQSYSMKHSRPGALQIEGLAEGYLPDLADDDRIVDGFWE